MYLWILDGFFFGFLVFIRFSLDLETISCDFFCAWSFLCFTRSFSERKKIHNFFCAIFWCFLKEYIFATHGGTCLLLLCASWKEKKSWTFNYCVKNLLFHKKHRWRHIFASPQHCFSEMEKMYFNKKHIVVLMEAHICFYEKHSEKG